MPNLKFPKVKCIKKIQKGSKMIEDLGAKRLLKLKPIKLTQIPLSNVGESEDADFVSSKAMRKLQKKFQNVSTKSAEEEDAEAVSSILRSINAKAPLKSNGIKGLENLGNTCFFNSGKKLSANFVLYDFLSRRILILFLPPSLPLHSYASSEPYRAPFKVFSLRFE